MTVRARLTALYALCFGGVAALLMAVSYGLLRDHLRGTLPPASAERALDELAAQYGLAFAGTMLLSVALGWAVAGRALAPLRAVTATARHINTDRLDRRIDFEGPHDEVRELADTFDAMLDRLQESFVGQERFVANASHELRSPLTLIRTEAEVALADPDPEPGEMVDMARAVKSGAIRMERLLDGLMVLARSQRGTLRTTRIDLAELVGHAAGNVGTEAAEAGVELRVFVDPAPGSGDAELLGRLVENLLENGVRYNRPGGWVAVTTRAGDDGDVLLEVENSGPVIDPADVTRLVEPFERLGRRTDGLGAGLGLSIVRSVAQAHGGTLGLAARPAGGLSATVRLPGG